MERCGDIATIGTFRESFETQWVLNTYAPGTYIPFGIENPDHNTTRHGLNLILILGILTITQSIALDDAALAWMAYTGASGTHNISHVGNIDWCHENPTRLGRLGTNTIELCTTNIKTDDEYYVTVFGLLGQRIGANISLTDNIAWNGVYVGAEGLKYNGNLSLFSGVCLDKNTRLTLTDIGVVCDGMNLLQPASCVPKLCSAQSDCGGNRKCQSHHDMPGLCLTSALGLSRDFNENSNYTSLGIVAWFFILFAFLVWSKNTDNP